MLWKRLLAVGAMLTGMSAMAGAADWTTITGQIIHPKDKKPAEMKVITPNVNVKECNKDGAFSEETWVVNPKNGGLKNVVVYLQAEGYKRGDAFKTDDIHPSLKSAPSKAAEIDQPCCKFIPHVLAVRAGQDLVIKNSAPMPHNAKWESRENGSINPLIPSGGSHTIKALKPEFFPIQLQCSIHGWMNGWVRVFDHPYFAVTDDDGKFEIKNAPVGKYNLVVWHETGWSKGKEGRDGIKIELVPVTTNVGTFEFDDLTPLKNKK
jgi:hypothetical protein